MATDYKIVDKVLIIEAGREEIDSNEFYGLKIKKAIIPEGIKRIGSWGFGGCEKLEEVVLPASIESIAKDAFALCPLKEIIFTDGCPNLKEVYISSFTDYSPWTQKQRKEHEFFMFGTKLFMHGEGSSSVIIPNGVEIIGASSFSENDQENVIEEVTIPEGVKTIERGAFAACRKLKSVHLPSSLEIIEDSAFSGCENLVEIVLPDNLKSLGASVFDACSSLEMITFPEKLKTIGEDLFSSGYFSVKMKLQKVVGLIPAMLNGCKINAKTSMWLLQNLWKDENSLQEIVAVYLTQSGTKVLSQAELILWRNAEQTISIMQEFKANYKLKPATIKKIDAFIEQHA